MGESFGMSRCGLLADAIVDADEQRIAVPQRASTRSDRATSPRTAWRSTPHTVNHRWTAVMSSDAPFLEAAATIARRIVADAVWHNGRCSWMGAVAEPGSHRRPSITR